MFCTVIERGSEDVDLHAKTPLLFPVSDWVPYVRIKAITVQARRFHVTLWNLVATI